MAVKPITVRVAFGPEIQPALQQHLDGGIGVAEYVRAAVAFYNKVGEIEKKGHTIGHSRGTDVGDFRRFKEYNEQISLDVDLELLEEEE